MKTRSTLRSLVYAVIVGAMLTSCAKRADVVMTPEDLETSLNEGLVVAGLRVVALDKRVVGFDGLCRNLDTDSEVKCLSSDSDTFVFSKDRIEKEDGDYYHAVAVNIYKLPVGTYKLHTIKFYVRIGTRYGGSVHSIGGRPIVDRYELPVRDDVTFQVEQGYTYLGRITIGIHQDHLFRPFVSRVFVANNLKEDVMSLPRTVRPKVRRGTKGLAAQLEGFDRTNDDYVAYGQWGPQPLNGDSQWCGRASLTSEVKSKSVEILTRMDLFPVFPSKEFSDLLSCMLSNYMEENDYREFKATGRLRREAVGRPLERIKYTMPLTFR